MIKKSITVTDQQENWIQNQVASGLYGNDSEVIREALREKQMRMAEIDLIRARLEAAEKTEFSDSTPEDIRQSIKSEMKRNGEL